MCAPFPFTVTTHYDAADRADQITDSDTGSVGRTYDGLDRLKRETSLSGQVDYTYYPNGLRNTLTLAGLPAITTTYAD